VWFASCYAHVFVRLQVVIVTDRLLTLVNIRLIYSANQPRDDSGRRRVGYTRLFAYRRSPTGTCEPDNRSTTLSDGTMKTGLLLHAVL